MPALEPVAPAQMATAPVPAPCYKSVRYAVGAVIDVVVSHVEPDAMFYVQPLAAARQLDSLMADINSGTAALVATPRGAGIPPGQPCLARCAVDGVVYRAVLSAAGGGTTGGDLSGLMVTRVDFGGAMEAAEVYAMGQRHAGAANMPVASVKCRLAGVEGCPTSAVVGVLKLYESVAGLVAKVRRWGGMGDLFEAIWLTSVGL